MIFLNEDQRIALSAGSSWHENHRETNAIGTVLVEQSAITVQGAEHFMSQRHALSCSAEFTNPRIYLLDNMPASSIGLDPINY